MQGASSNIDYKELYEGQLVLAADLSGQYEKQLARTNSS
jgi:hypothetical protein